MGTKNKQYSSEFKQDAVNYYYLFKFLGLFYWYFVFLSRIQNN